VEGLEIGKTASYNAQLAGNFFDLFDLIFPRPLLGGPFAALRTVHCALCAVRWRLSLECAKDCP